jgi:hypothetical protein
METLKVKSMVRYYCNKCGRYHYAGAKVPSIFKKHVDYRDKPFGDYKEPKGESSKSKHWRY